MSDGVVVWSCIVVVSSVAMLCVSIKFAESGFLTSARFKRARDNTVTNNPTPFIMETTSNSNKRKVPDGEKDKERTTQACCEYGMEGD